MLGWGCDGFLTGEGGRRGCFVFAFWTGWGWWGKDGGGKMEGKDGGEKMEGKVLGVVEWG